MNNFHKLSTLLLCSALLSGGCTEETKQTSTDPVTPGADNSRREVMMTLKNKLSVNPVSSKAGTPIATAAENAISTLDVYVFGATQENGDYTFLERFAYRADANDKLPQGANELQLNTTDADGNETNGLLKLKKGLFVKLYCIANDTTLVDPVTTKVVKPADFTPITFAESEDGTPRLATEGIPHESTFTTYHTHLLSADVPADTLATPLAMAGALTTPLDLTDSGSAARLQIGFRLTRLVARYDINNEAGSSRFIIETVSIGKARRGSGYFPIRPYGDMPEAKPDELITSPARRFYGEKANKGLQAGAFYSYPSPEKDNAFLILKGMYKVNETEYKEVSYRVPFTRQNENGTATIFEIANNHRYTLAVTAADLYHLDCNISVDDWADDGSIIEFNPNEDTGELAVTIPEGFKDDTKYDPDTRSVSMSLKPGSQFELKTTASSNLMVEKKYVGGLAAQQYDWLQVSEPAVSTKTALNFAYTFSLKEGYTLGRYPRAVLRFTNTMNGNETTFFVEAVSVPQADNTPQPGTNNPNTFDAENLLVSLYRTTGSNAHVRITCPDGTEVESKPDWLDVAIDRQNGAETIYSFTLNDRDITGVPEDKGTVTFRNKKAGELKTDITVQLLDATLKPDFNTPTIDGTKNSYEAATDDKPANVNMQISDANSFAITCRSMQGIEIGLDFDGGPEWLKAAGANVTRAYNENAELTFSLDNAKLGGAKKATVTLKNKVGGKNTVFTVSPVFLVPTVAFVSGSNSPTQNTMSGTTIKLYQVNGSKVSFKANALGGTYVKTLTGDISVETTDDNYNAEKTYVVTWKSGTSASFVIANKSDETKETAAYTVNAPVTTITATDNLNMNTLASQNVTNTINSPEGCTASVNWGTGGQAWFDLSATNFNANSQALKMTTKSNITTLTNIQKATITLTNKITGGTVKTFTVTPVYQFISTEQTSSTGNNLIGTAINMVKMSSNSGYHAQITLKVVSLGGSKVAVSGTGLKLTGANSSTTYTASYTLDAAYNAAASGTLTITNYQNANSKKTYTINVVDGTVTYTSKSTGNTYPALEMASYWVAPVTEGLWNFNDAQSKCPEGWRLPNRGDFQNFVRYDKQNMIDKFLAGGDPNGKGCNDAPNDVAYWSSYSTYTYACIANNFNSYNYYRAGSNNFSDATSGKKLNVRCIKNK